MPDKCSVAEEGKQCVNPPEFIVSIVDGKDEYMFGLTCQKHRSIVSGKLGILQNEGKIQNGKISLILLKPVETDGVNGCSLSPSKAPDTSLVSHFCVCGWLTK